MLISAGFGTDHHDIAARLTWRQINHYAAVLVRRARHQQADTIQAMALAFGGKDLPQILREMRA